MADNVLAQVPRKRYPTLDEQMRSDIVNYLSRLKSDFVTSGERAGQGLGQVIDDGNYLEGVPRVVLGGLGALGAPVSAAVSPVLGPLLQPVGEAVDTYVGQPIEQATGYPADITNEVFLTTATAGMAPLLKPALKGTGNFLAKMGDAAEAGLNRVGYTARPQAGTLFSGGGPVNLADDVAGGGQGANVHRMAHRPPSEKYGAPLHDLTQMFPDDVYGKVSDAANYYGHGLGKLDERAVRMAQQFRGKPDAEVTIYRAVPENGGEIGAGDWVTLDKEYAKHHGEGPLQGNYKIVSRKVKAAELWTSTDSIHEFGWHPVANGGGT